MNGQPFIDWEWVGGHLDLIGQRLLEHIWLTVLAVTIGLLISLPVAVYAHRHPRFYPPATWVTGIMYTIPSIALLGFLVPFTGLTTLTAEVALVSYTLLILLRNIVTGLDGVPEDVKEAATGMGMTRRQLLWKVEFPMALPVIVAGIRIATVSTIGLVLVTILVGKGGVGYLMIAGFRRLLPRTTAVTIGAVLAVLLAVAADLLLLLGQRRLTPWAARFAGRAAT
ncbi:MAG TPA: ABC transporter permease [Actinomycetota bacterium]|nr:ABC transporter permease [Actinomycetota bacterium]